MPHSLDKTRLAEVITACEDSLEKLSKWEQGFVASVSDQFYRTGSLSEKQCEVLEKIYLKV
jgi:uncharacterized membrane-anchored protein